MEKAVVPKSVKGGPEVVTFAPPEPKESKARGKPIRKPAKKLTPEQRENRQDLLSASDFVEKHRREVRTASWNPKDVRKCGRAAEQILVNLGATKRKEKVPFHEQARRKRLHEEQAELAGKRK